MPLKLLSTLVASGNSYGCGVWGSLCHGSLISDAITLQGMRIAFLRNVCGRFPVCTTEDSAAASFAESAEDPGSLKRWVQLVGFALRISDLPQVSLHLDILR